ncbi:MAG: pyridoxine 5'-phosphate synthase [Polyangia bacterium]
MKLHINVDHVATLRQARGTRYPDPSWASSLCELAGADGITIHLREDRRHIQDRDVLVMRETCRGVLNLEMAATDEMVGIALATKPDVVTLVPEKREERTTEGGLDVTSAATAKAVRALAAAGIPVSLFIDPTEAAVRATHALGCPRIELHTGDYCEAWTPRDEANHGDAAGELARLRTAAELGQSLGLHVAAGHGLDYGNVGPIAAIPAIVELNIGHAIVARAVLVGMERAVREMRVAMLEARA